MPQNSSLKQSVFDRFLTILRQAQTLYDLSLTEGILPQLERKTFIIPIPKY
jgi:hypothetical protein